MVVRGTVPPQIGTDVYGHRVTERTACLRYPEVGSFLISDGSSITVDAEPSASDALLRNFILGPALAVALHQRGTLVLHASAVMMGGVAALFLGDSEWGKSTAAAACYLDGGALVADDTVAVVDIGVRPSAVPAIPVIKLWPDSLIALGLDPEAFDLVHEELDKRRFPAGRGFPVEPVPIGAAYVLSDGFVGLEEIHGSEALIELVRHSYAVDLLRASSTQGRHLQQCADLLTRVRLCRLGAGDSLGDVRRIPAVISADLS